MSVRHRRRLRALVRHHRWLRDCTRMVAPLVKCDPRRPWFKFSLTEEYKAKLWSAA